jgi:hypothetical protein
MRIFFSGHVFNDGKGTRSTHSHSLSVQQENWNVRTSKHFVFPDQACCWHGPHLSSHTMVDVIMNKLVLHERRGLNRQQAFDYLGVKSSYFNKEIRPLLTAMRMGTSVVFDRHDLDIVFERIKLALGDVGPTVKGEAQWPKEPPESSKQKTAAGGSTRLTREIDFRDVLKRIKQRKNGC